MAHDVADPVQRLAAYRPTAAVLEAEWSAADRAGVRAAVLAARPARAARLRFVPRRRRTILLPGLSAVALVALMMGIVLLAAPSGEKWSPAAGTPFDAGSITPTPRVGAGEYAYRAVDAFKIVAGSVQQTGRDQYWAATDGSIWIVRSATGCVSIPSSGPGLESPTQGFFDHLPTRESALNTYLRTNVSGSTSRDEAVFVAVGDMLREGDLLASSRLRATAVEVLSRTARITVHTGVRDYLGRPAVRADFLDPQNRPGELTSLYFDAATFQLLEERQGSSGGPDSYGGPSPAYDGPPPAGQPDTGTELTGDANVYVMTEEKVVDRLPAAVADCSG